MVVVVFFGTRGGESLIAAPKAESARDGSCTPLKPLRRWLWGGVQATARDPKPYEGDESLTAQKKNSWGAKENRVGHKKKASRMGLPFWAFVFCRCFIFSFLG